MECSGHSLYLPLYVYVKLCLIYILFIFSNELKWICPRKKLYTIEGYTYYILTDAENAVLGQIRFMIQAWC